MEAVRRSASGIRRHVWWAYGLFLMAAGLLLLYVAHGPQIPGHQVLSANPQIHNCTGRTYQLPGYIIIGAKKCGTGTLIHFLSWLNPWVRATLDEHSSQFFNQHYDKGLEYYRKLLPCTASREIAGENCPAYFANDDVPARIKAMNSSIKLVLVVCDPVKRLISDYTHFRSSHGMASLTQYKHFVSRGKANEYTESYFPSLEWLVFNNGTFDTRFLPLLMGYYDVYIKNWLKHFPKKQIYFVDGESLINQPWKALNGLERFLGVPNLITRENFTFVKSKGFYCLNMSTNIHCMKNTKGRRHPDVTKATLEKLHEHYTPHIRQFFKLIDRSFDWGYK